MANSRIYHNRNNEHLKISLYSSFSDTQLYWERALNSGTTPNKAPNPQLPKPTIIMDNKKLSIIKFTMCLNQLTLVLGVLRPFQR